MNSKPTISRRSFLDKLLVGTGIGAAGAIFGAAFSVLDKDAANPGAEATQEFSEGPRISGAVAEAVPAELEAADTSRRKTITLEAVDATLEIAGGVEYNAWTFGQRVPGPVVHVREGDTVEFTFVNNARSGGHSIDFHSAQTPWNLNYKTILPGDSLSFDWQANFPGAFMYHCGTAPVLHHISNGMYGAVIVDPAEALPAAREFVLVQSEFYASSTTNGNPWSGDMAKMMANRPDVLAFNGKAFQYRDHPLTAEAGELIRMYVVNAGPTQFSAFHVIGAVFSRVLVDGNPNNAMQGVSTWTIPPGGAATFELTIPEPGQYPFVTHSFAYTELGAVGLLDVT